jgi:nucleoside-diphosphate-sugar epimerase
VTLLVTGATGLIGRELVRMAGAASDTFAVARDPSSPQGSGSGCPVRWLALDLRDPAFAQQLPERVDAIVHLAQSRQYHDFPGGADDMFEVNLAATAGLLEYARRACVKRFVFASTATLYAPSHAALTERSPIQCGSFYAASKRAAELLIEQYAELMFCWLVRIFTVYGRGQREQLIANLVHRVQRGDSVTVQGRSGLPVSPIHAADVAKTLWQVATPEAEVAGPGCEIVNLGGPERLAIRELAEQIGNAVGVSPNFSFSAGDDPPGWVADRTKLEQLLPAAAPRSFADGIRDVLAGGDTGPLTA